MTTVENVFINNTADFPRGLSRSSQAAIAAASRTRRLDPWNDQPRVEPRPVERRRACPFGRNPEDGVGVDFQVEQYDPERDAAPFGNLRDRRPLSQRPSLTSRPNMTAMQRIQRRRDDAAMARSNSLLVNELDQDLFPGERWNGPPDDILRRPAMPNAGMLEAARGYAPPLTEGAGQAVVSDLNGGFPIRDQYQDLQRLGDSVLQLRSTRETNRAFINSGQSILSTEPLFGTTQDPVMAPRVSRSSGPTQTIRNDFDAPFNVDTAAIDVVGRATVENPISASALKKIQETIVPMARIPEIQVETSYDKVLSRILQPAFVQNQGSIMPTIPQDAGIQFLDVNPLNLLPSMPTTTSVPLQNMSIQTAPPIPFVESLPENIASLLPSNNITANMSQSYLAAVPNDPLPLLSEDPMSMLPSVRVAATPSTYYVSRMTDTMPNLSDLPTSDKPILPVTQTSTRLQAPIDNTMLFDLEAVSRNSGSVADTPLTSFQTFSNITAPIQSQYEDLKFLEVTNTVDQLLMPRTLPTTTDVQAIYPYDLRLNETMERVQTLPTVPADSVPLTSTNIVPMSGPWDGKVQQIDDWLRNVIDPVVVDDKIVQDATVVPFTQAFAHQPAAYDGDVFTITRDEHMTRAVRQLHRPKEYLDKRPDNLDVLVDETQRLLLETSNVMDPLGKQRREAGANPMPLREVQREDGRVNVTVATKRNPTALHDMLQKPSLVCQPNPMLDAADWTDTSDFAF